MHCAIEPYSGSSNVLRSYMSFFVQPQIDEAAGVNSKILTSERPMVMLKYIVGIWSH